MSFASFSYHDGWEQTGFEDVPFFDSSPKCMQSTLSAGCDEEETGREREQGGERGRGFGVHSVGSIFLE